MKVNGEIYFFVNGGIDFLCLCWISGLFRLKFVFKKALAASFLGAVYAVLALCGPGFLGSFPVMLAIAFCMALIAFGRLGFPAFALLIPAGYLFSGAVENMGRGKTDYRIVLAVCLGITVLTRALLSCGRIKKTGKYMLRLRYGGKTVFFPAIRDSGNMLWDQASGLPVIVAAQKQVKALLPSGICLEDLSTLPKGFHLICVSTAAGRKTLMCFRPDCVEVTGSGRTRRIRAAVALSDMPESRALLPETLFENDMEEGYHASA